MNAMDIAAALKQHKPVLSESPPGTEMQRNEYNAVVRSLEVWESIVISMGTRLLKENPGMNLESFYKACGQIGDEHWKPEDILRVLAEGFERTQEYHGFPRLHTNKNAEVDGDSLIVVLDNGQRFKVEVAEEK